LITASSFNLQRLRAQSLDDAVEWLLIPGNIALDSTLWDELSTQDYKKLLTAMVRFKKKISEGYDRSYTGQINQHDYRNIPKNDSAKLRDIESIREYLA
jgi:hypothetical protein